MNKLLLLKNIKGKRILAAFAFLLMFAAFPSASNAGTMREKTVLEQANDTKVTVNVTNETLRNILLSIQRQSGIGFAIDESVYNSFPRKSLNLNDVTVVRALDALVEGTDYTHRIVNDQIVIVRNEGQSRNAQPVEVTVSGRVVYADSKEPVLGAAVTLVGTTTGMSTGVDGTFSLKARTGQTLSVTYIGMLPYQQEITRAASNLTIELQENVVEAADIVITGIFNKVKESYTGAAKTITSAELKRSGNRNLLTTIANVDPSFNIVTNLDFGSDPNKLPDITMRGNTSIDTNIRDLQSDSRTQSRNNPNLPLFILDGFEISLERMTDLDDNQIESVTILKDASATAMYGTRGANGVVVIKSILPEAGRIRVSYKGDLSIEAPDLTSYNLMDAREKLEYERIAGLYTGNGTQGQQLQELYNERLRNIQRGIDTYWLKYPVRTGVGNKHSVRIDAGGQELRMSAGLGYNNIAGAMKGSDRNTFNGNLQVNYSHKSLTFQNNLQITVNRANNSPYGSFSTWTKAKSYYKPYDENGDLEKYLENFTYSGAGLGTRMQNKAYNPLYDAVQPSKDESKYTLIKNDFAVDWSVTDDLKLRGRFSIYGKNYRSDKYIPSNNTKFDDYTGDDIAKRGTYDMGIEEDFGFETDLTLSYSKTLSEKHQIYAGLSINYADDKYESFLFQAEGISNPRMDFIGMAARYKDGVGPTGVDEHSRRLGSILNFNYTYDRRYFVDLTGTIEGSSKFGADNRTAPFFSTGIGWNMHHENFLRGNNILNVARLRLSYGTSGSQAFDAYQAYRTFKDYGDVTYMGWYGSFMRALGNEDLGWQQTRQLNFGADFNLFNNRLEIVFDLYNKKTDDLLSQITIPSAGGFNSYLANIGKVDNKGFEINMNTILIRNSESRVYWNVGAALIYNKNKIREISNSLEFLNEERRKEDPENITTALNPSFLYEEGKSINTIYVVKSLGIDPGNGKELFVKRDGSLTYEWDAADKVACGTTDPKFKGNLMTMFRYRNWTLNAIFTYYWGGQLYNNTLASKVENISPYDNADRRALYDRWSEPGQPAQFKRITDFNYTKATSRFVMDDNIFTLKNLRVSYDFDARWMERVGMGNLTLSASTEDVFVISSIKQERGTSYPFSRKFYFTVSATF